MARRRPVGRRGLPVVTSEGCSYSGTWSWAKLVSVPGSPLLGLYDTVPVELYRQLHVNQMLRIGNVTLHGRRVLTRTHYTVYTVQY